MLVFKKLFTFFKKWFVLLQMMIVIDATILSITLELSITTLDALFTLLEVSFTIFTVQATNCGITYDCNLWLQYVFRTDQGCLKFGITKLLWYTFQTLLLETSRVEPSSRLIGLSDITSINNGTAHLDTYVVHELSYGAIGA